MSEEMKNENILAEAQAPKDIPEERSVVEEVSRAIADEQVTIEAHAVRQELQTTESDEIAIEDTATIEALQKNAHSKKAKWRILKDGLLDNNPVFRLVLGTCPILAVTTSVKNGLAMGLASTFVLLCSNVLVSLLRHIIPDKARIPCYITIIAAFVTLVQMVMRKFIPALYDALGLFIPLIVVNCIILARAETFASVNKVSDSAIDGIGMGLGFTLSLMIMGFFRELLGAGKLFGWEIPFLSRYAMTVFILPAGGFITFGFLMALVVFVTAKSAKKKEASK